MLRHQKRKEIKENARVTTSSRQRRPARIRCSTYTRNVRIYLPRTTPCRPASTPSEGKKQHAMRSNVWATIHKEGCGTSTTRRLMTRARKKEKNKSCQRLRATSSVARQHREGAPHIHTEYVVGAQLIFVTGAHLLPPQASSHPCGHATQNIARCPQQNYPTKAKGEDRRSLLLCR